MPGFLRPKLRAISAVFPQLDNNTWITPRRGIAGLLFDSQFGVSSDFWTLTGNADIKQGRCTLGAISQVEQNVHGVSDGSKVIISITAVEAVSGLITVDYNGVLVDSFSVPGVHDFSVTAGGANLLEISAAGALDGAILESVFARDDNA